MDEAVEAAFRAIWEREPIRGTGDDGRLAAMARALSAADAARAVGDEEVVEVMTKNQSAWHGCDNTGGRCSLENCGCKDDAHRLLRALRAAGLEVVRG